MDMKSSAGDLDHIKFEVVDAEVDPDTLVEVVSLHQFGFRFSYRLWSFAGVILL